MRLERDTFRGVERIAAGVPSESVSRTSARRRSHPHAEKIPEMTAWPWQETISPWWTQRTGERTKSHLPWRLSRASCCALPSATLVARDSRPRTLLQATHTPVLHIRIISVNVRTISIQRRSLLRPELCSQVLYHRVYIHDTSVLHMSSLCS